MYTQAGNFKACDHGEHSYKDLKIISGAVPQDITGVYLRNGPNPQFLPKTNRNHLFDGDAMVHAVRIKNGSLWYCNRYIETPRFKKEQAAGQALGPRVGEMFGKVGMGKVLLKFLQINIGYIDYPPKKYDGTANTAFAHHAKRTYALYETDYPFHLLVDKKEDKLDIKSIGHDNFDGQLTHNCSAHPKVDRRAGQFLVFGTARDGPFAEYTLFNKDKKKENYLKITLDGQRMLHDFGVTEKYAILPDLPMELNPQLAVKEDTFIIKFD